MFYCISNTKYTYCKYVKKKLRNRIKSNNLIETVEVFFCFQFISSAKNFSNRKRRLCCWRLIRNQLACVVHWHILNEVLKCCAVVDKFSDISQWKIIIFGTMFKYKFLGYLRFLFLLFVPKLCFSGKKLWRWRFLKRRN